MLDSTDMLNSNHKKSDLFSRHRLGTIGVLKSSNYPLFMYSIHRELWCIFPNLPQMTIVKLCTRRNLGSMIDIYNNSYVKSVTICLKVDPKLHKKNSSNNRIIYISYNFFHAHGNWYTLIAWTSYLDSQFLSRLYLVHNPLNAA